VRSDPVIGRRTLLGLVGMSAGLVAVARVRPPLGSSVALAADEGFQVLRPDDARVLGAIAERMVFTGDPNMPLFRDTGGLRTIDHALRQLPEATRGQLSWALLIFQYAPPLFGAGLATFTGLSEENQDAYLRQWEHSGLETLGIAFRAFKNLCMLGYYAHDATWKSIHYDGPWVPRPRRVAEA
jgi:hypothetical protein